MSFIKVTLVRFCANSFEYFYTVRLFIIIALYARARIDESNLLRDILHFARIDHAQ